MCVGHGMLYVSNSNSPYGIYSVDLWSYALVRVDRALVGTLLFPGSMQLDVTQSVLWISDVNTGQLFRMPLATGIPTPVPWVAGLIGPTRVVLDVAHRYAYAPINGGMWRINVQDMGGVAFADQDGHRMALHRSPMTFNQTSMLAAAFFIVPDISRPFPLSLLLTRIVKSTAGNVTASLDGGLTVLPLDVAVLVHLPPFSGASNWTILVNGTLGGLFSVTVVNPCGFAASVVGGPGSVCAPAASACIPLDSATFSCAPYVLSHSLRVVAPSAINTDAATCATGCFGAAGARALVLPPSIVGLFVRFDIASSSIRANFSVTNPAPFTVLEVAFVSDFAATSVVPCAHAAVVAVHPSNVTVQCALPGSLIGAAFRIRLRTQAGIPLQCTTFIGADSVSSFAPAISPLSLARVSPFPHRVNASSYGDLIALGQGETLSIVVSFSAWSVPAVQVYIGSMNAIQSVWSAAAINRSDVSYALPDSQLIPNSRLPMLDQSPGLIPCTIRPDLLTASLLVCTMPAFGVTGTLLHAMVVLGGQVAVSSDSYSYPTVPLIERVSSSQCVDSGNGTAGCPTRGGVTLTVTGTLFSLSDSQVLVDGLTCPVTTMGLDGLSIECTLPAGAGTNVAVVVQAYGVFSAAFTLLSYASPEIDGISSSACDSDSSGVLLTDCDRLGNATLTLHGRNFGPAGSKVFVGLHSCASDGVQHADPHSTTSCRMPRGKTLDQPVILLQKNGQLSASAVSLSYMRCPAGTREPDSANPLALDCIRCDPGSFSAAGASSCTECPAGSVAPAFGSVSCDPCPQRTRRLHVGGTECESCLTGEYQQSVGSAECLSCPSGLYLNSASLNASVDNCAACPDGATCGAGALISANGFYITRSADGSIHSFQCPTGYCTACTSPVQSSMFNGTHSLLASVATCCAANRDPSSPLCGSCLPGFVEWSGVCQPCDRPNSGLIFLIFLLSFVVVVWLLRSSATAPTGVLAVFLYFTQSAVLQLGSTSALLSWIGFFQFDLSFFVPRSSSASCLAPIDGYGQTVLALCVPLIFLAELCLIAIVHRIAFQLAKPAGATESSEGNELAAAAPQSDADPSSSSWRVSVTGRARAELGGLYSRWSRSFDYWSYINCCMAIGLFTYTQVVSTCVKFLWCVEVDDRSVVFSTPSMDCRSDQYARVFGFVIAVIVVYVVGFPLAILIAGLQRARKRQAEGRKLHDAATVPGQSDAALAASAPWQWSAGSVSAGQWHLASLFGMYRDRIWYWSSVVLVRRALFVVADVTLAQRQQYRSMAFAMLNTASVHSLILIRPLQLAQLNSVEVASHVLLLLIALLQATDNLPYSHGLQICFFLLIVPPLVLYGLFVLRARRQAAASAAGLAATSPTKSPATDIDSCVDVGADDFDPPLQRNPSLALASSPVVDAARARAAMQPEHIEMREMKSPTQSAADRSATAEERADSVESSARV